MKKNILILSLLTLGLAGCSQEELIDNNANQKPAENKVFTATLEKEDAQSRVYVGNDNNLFWTAEDQISIFAGNTVNTVYQFDGETGATSGTFTAVATTSTTTGSDLSNNHAIYPYNEATTISTEGVITTTLPATQKYAENSFGLGDNTMVAVTNGTEDYNLNFKNVCGYLKLQLYGTNVTVKTITLTGNNNEKLAGKATVTFGNDGVPTVSMADDATTSITLDCGNGVTIGDSENEATTFWMVVPPTRFTQGFTVTATTTDDVTFTQSTSNEIAIARNRVKPMKALGKNLGEGTMLLPSGSTFKSTIKSFLDANTNLTKIKFIDNSTKTSSHILETDVDGTVAYMVANGEWLEIHTNGRKFVANEDCKHMFSQRENFTDIIFGENFDTSQVKNMSWMFWSCSSLTTLDLSNFDTSNVTDMSWMIYYLPNLTSLNIGNFNTSNVTDMTGMFAGCQKMTTFSLTHFNTSKVKDISSMFSGCHELTTLDLSSFDTSSVTDMHTMFFECWNLTSLTLGSKFNTSNVTDMSYMFSKCKDITSLPVSGFNTTQVTNMKYMFNECQSLTTLDVSSFKTSNVTDMSWMFFGCSKLTSLDLASFTFEKSPKVTYMLYLGSSVAISVNVNEAGHTYLTETKTDHKLPSTSKFVRPNGTEW